MNDPRHITKTFALLARFFDEREVMLLVSAEAECVSRGGIAEVARATRISRRRIAGRIKELRQEERLTKGRVRRPGGGRKKMVGKDATLERDLELLIEPSTRGDPESLSTWTCKSLRRLARGRTAMGHKVAKNPVGRLLHQKGYGFQERTERPWKGRPMKTVTPNLRASIPRLRNSSKIGSLSYR